VIDSLILPKVLDVITNAGCLFHIKNISIGQDRSDPSYAVIDVRANQILIWKVSLPRSVIMEPFPKRAVTVKLSKPIATVFFPKHFTAQPTNAQKFALVKSGYTPPVASHA
tara:strand:- start:56 stop:388 length:333 start_codon:yes stop_codon:yes gene_type:complete